MKLISLKFQLLTNKTILKNCPNYKNYFLSIKIFHYEFISKTYERHEIILIIKVSNIFTYVFKTKITHSGKFRG